ncbi:MAG: TIGR03013 family XrtA/PEP-CTERM system glycosyltransferase [Thermodesulfobacteriota bacterium]|nr:TIGR03013 family XrtA/PEP-CTERM system glycosyltransferase [Thermodesulfobacteriota bacterium]
MIRLFRQYLSVRKAAFVLGEGALVFLSVTLVSYFLLGRGVGMKAMLSVIWPQVLTIAVITQLSLYFNDLYEFKHTDNALDFATRLLQSIGITSIALAIVYFFWPGMIIGKWVFFVSLILMLLSLVSWRILYFYVIRNKLFAEKTVMVGTGELAGDILGEIRRRSDLSYDISAAITHNGKDEDPRQGLGRIPLYHGFNRIEEVVEAENAKGIIVALDEKRGVFPFNELLACKMKGVNIIDGQSFYERITGKLLVEKMPPSWLIFSDGFVKSRFARATKRVLGLSLSAFLLFVLFPLFLVVAAAVKLTSRGPSLFSQERVGEFGKPFTLYKFRSMRVDAEEETGPVWATEDDPRITRVGKIIRKLRVDELPQLWNVFRGDMSFVGPRPERRYFVEQLKEKVPYYNERFSVKPGVTGWAQIKYPYGASEKDALEKLKFDLYYIKNMSMVFDIAVVFHTIKIVLLGRGSR